MNKFRQQILEERKQEVDKLTRRNTVKGIGVGMVTFSTVSLTFLLIAGAIALPLLFLFSVFKGLLWFIKI